MLEYAGRGNIIVSNVSDFLLSTKRRIVWYPIFIVCTAFSGFVLYFPFFYFLFWFFVRLFFLKEFQAIRDLSSRGSIHISSHSSTLNL